MTDNLISSRKTMKKKLNALAVLKIAAMIFYSIAIIFIATIPFSLEVNIAIAVGLSSVLFLAYALREKDSIKNNFTIRFFVISAGLFLSLHYLYWRGTQTLPLEANIATLIFGVALFLTECYCFVISLLSYINNINPTHRESLPLPADFSTLPHVDVFIPTYDEDIHIVSPTLVAATQMHYPKEKLHVYLLDDGGTLEKCQSKNKTSAAHARHRANVLKALAAQFGATYLTRERNISAKAGNINHALKNTSGELVAIFDCDHIPASDFLIKTVGFFLKEEKLFLVQTPHNLINADPLERNLSRLHHAPAENALFYGLYKQGLDSWGMTFFCGSAALLRRSVLDEIGGIAEETVTEDAETTLEALAKGYTTLYYDQPMISGLQPETFSSFIRQRARWAQGMLQIFILKNPWTKRGLSFMQRLLFTNLVLSWLFPIQRLIMLLTPPVVLLFSMNITVAKLDMLLVMLIPSILGSILVSQYLYGNLRWPFVSILYEVMQSIHLTFGILKLIINPRAPKFQVTPKGEVLEENFISSLAKPFYFILCINIAAIIQGLISYQNATEQGGMILFITVWAICDLLFLLSALGITFERRQRRSSPRAIVEEPVRLHAKNGEMLRGVMIDASVSGARIRFACIPEDLDNLAINDEVVIDLPTRLMSFTCSIQKAVMENSTYAIIGVAYHLQTTNADRIAVDIAYGSSEQIRKNNKLHEQGQNILQGLFNILYFALVPGLGHIYFLISQPFKKLGKFQKNFKTRGHHA